MEKKKSKKKLYIILGVIAGVILIGAMVIINLQSSFRSEISVQTKVIEQADIISKVSGSGRVEPKTKVNIVSEVNAEIISLPIKEGDYVRNGQILIQLDTIQLKSDMESALYNANETEARVEGAKVLLDQYRDEYNRQKGLYEKKLTSEQAYTNANYAFQRQESEYKAWIQQKNASRSRLKKARDNLSKTTIKSPMDGTVTLVDAEKGEIAQAQTSFTQGKTLMVVSDLSAFEIEVEIDETDIADLELYQTASIEIDAFPDTTFAGEVVEIGNTATLVGFGSSDQSTNFKVIVTLLDLHPKIRPGMSSTVDIVTNEHNDVLAVPIQAVVMRKFDPDSLAAAEKPAEASDEPGVAIAATTEESDSAKVKKSKGDKEKIEKKGVFVNRDGIATFVEIETGIVDQKNYEVLSGLEEEDEVITGSFRTLRTIKDGQAIKVENPDKNED
ncbi:MAG: efflux RND transporter periplasmic adaptor subunit [candidate division Zixibacteria bacterium]